MPSDTLRSELTTLLGIPTDRCDLAPEPRGQFERDGVVIEKWIWTSEPGSRVPSVLYRPSDPEGKIPAMVIACGHGGSKSQWSLTYIGQTYARLGIACLVLDPIGEEERHIRGEMGTRAHDPDPSTPVPITQAGSSWASWYSTRCAESTSCTRGRTSTSTVSVSRGIRSGAPKPRGCSPSNLA